MTYNYLFNNSPKLYVALRDLYQLSSYFKNCTCKGVVLDGFGIATVEVEISSTVPCDIENSLIRIIFRSDCANECIILIDGHTNIWSIGTHRIDGGHRFGYRHSSIRIYPDSTYIMSIRVNKGTPFTCGIVTVRAMSTVYIARIFCHLTIGGKVNVRCRRTSMIGPAINEMPVWRVICMNLIVCFKAQNQEITQTIPVQILREIKCINAYRDALLLTKTLPICREVLL